MLNIFRRRVPACKAFENIQEQDASDRKFILDLAKDMSGKLCLSNSLQRKELVAEALFLAAEQNVVILTRKLHESRWQAPAVIKAALHFLGKNSQAELIVLTMQDVNLEAHPLLVAMREAGLSDRIEVVTGLLKEPADISFNFAIADGRHYHHEFTNFYAGGMGGCFAFNNPSVVARLEKCMTTVLTAAGREPMRPAGQALVKEERPTV